MPPAAKGLLYLPRSIRPTLLAAHKLVESIAEICDTRCMLSPFAHQSSRHYQGGKGLAFRRLINLMPPHRVYVETHLGGGAVMRMKRAAASTIAIDRDPAVIELWQKRALPPGSQLICEDATKILRRLELGPEDLVYSDPPYPTSCRRGGRPYRCDMTDEQHMELLHALRSLDCRVMVSSYANPLYRRELCDWHIKSFDVQTHNGSARELVWMNFEPGSELHDYRYVGDDYRERERFRRRRENLVRRLRKADDLELNAVLADLAEIRPLALKAAAGRAP